MQTAAKKDSQFLKFLGEVRSHDVRPSSFRSKTGFFEGFREFAHSSIMYYEREKTFQIGILRK